ncbi:MAG: nucleotidyltransferase domain-containing protein [Nanoarchaeota archaeon]
MDIINKISPSKKERENVSKVINDFLKKIKPKLREYKLVIGGSMGKDSWLTGDHDVDIFVKFPKSYYKKDISKVLQERLKGIKFQVINGSRDYLQVKQGSYLFEIIPVIDIKRHEDALNITDVSPLHVIWVKKNNKNSDEIRLTKAFLKANNLYGAESYKKAFSGYVVELLTIYYDGFRNLITEASDWKELVVIDLSKFYKNKKEVLNNLNKDKLSSLILIDPVQPNRNAAASLSQGKFNEFIELCKKYSRNPSEKFFIEKKFNVNELKEKYSKYDVIVLKAKELQGKEDVVGSKLLKAFNYIKDKLIKEGWKIKEANWKWNNDVLFYYVIEKKKLSKELVHYGPPKKMEEYVEQFKKKWKNHKILQDNYHVYIKLKRKYTEIKPFVKALLKDKYLKNLVKNIKVK